MAIAASVRAGPTDPGKAVARRGHKIRAQAECEAKASVVGQVWDVAAPVGHRA